MPDLVPSPFATRSLVPSPFGPPQSRYDDENNAIVTLPPNSSLGFVTRESRENIGGQVGTDTYGTSDIGRLFNVLGAPGGLAQLSDIPTVVGILERPFAAPLGLVSQKIGKELAKEPATIFTEAQVAENIRDDLIDAVAFITQGDPGAALNSLIKAFSEPGKVQAGGVLGGLSIFGNVIRLNPAASESLARSLDNIQRANEDFLIRNNLMHGPNDERTIFGNFLDFTGDAGIAIGGAVFTKNPAVAAATLAVLQKERSTREALEAGKEPAEADIIGFGQALPEFVFNKIELGYFVDKVDRAGKSLAHKLFRGGLGEAGEELATELPQMAITEATGITDLTPEEKVSALIQAIFYGFSAGTTVTGGVVTVEKLLGVSSETTQFIQSEMEAEIAKDIESDVATESQIRSDSVSEAPVTKAAKNQAENEAKVAKLIKAFNEPETDFQAVVDEVLPEQRIAREKRLISDRQLAEDERTVRRTITARSRLLQQDLQTELAEQQRLATEFDTAFAAEKATKAIENRIDKNQERIDTIQEELQSLEATALEADVVTPGIVEELEGKGIIQRGGEVFQAATRSFDAAIRSFDAGVRAGTRATTAQTRALQENITDIINTLPIDDKTKTRLLKKVPKVNTVKNAQAIRNQIIAQGRTKAFAQFITDTRKSIKKTISENVTPKTEKAKLAPEFQNTIDRLSRMETDIKNNGLHETQAAIYKNVKGGIPGIDAIIQLRYLHILDDKADVPTDELATFADDLDAFISTGKGIASAVNEEQRARVERERLIITTSAVDATRSQVEAAWAVRTDEAYRFFGHTLQTSLDVTGLGDTIFNFTDADIDYRERREAQNQAKDDLADEITDGSGPQYLRTLSNSKGAIINENRAGLTNQLGNTKNIKMSRGQTIYAWMLLQEKSIREQIMNPKGQMGWTDEFVVMINDRMSDTDMQFATGMFGLYETTYAEFNEAYRARMNRDLPKVEFYSHITRKLDDNFDFDVYSNTAFYEQITDPATAGGLEGISEAKERKRDASKEIIISNVLDAWEAYNVDVQHYIAMAEQLDIASVLLADKDVRLLMETRMGKAGYKTFLEHMKMQARRNVVHNHFARIFSRSLEFFRKNEFSANLSLSAKIGIGQTSSVFGMIDGMPKGKGLAGIADYNIKGKEADKVLNQHSTFEKRGQHYDPAIDQLGRTGRFWKMTRWPVRKGDSWAVKAGAWSRIQWRMEQGWSQEKALNEAAKLAERSQQSTLNTQMTLAQKDSDPIVRAMVMWKSSMTSMWNMSVQAIAEYKIADKSTPEKKRAARNKAIETVAIQQIVVPGVYNAITGASRATVLAGASGALPFVGDIWEFTMAHLLNLFAEEDETVYTNGFIQIPLSESYEDVIRSLNAVINDFSVDSVMGVAETGVEVVKGLPGTNILDAGEGTKQLLEGENVTDGILKILAFKDAARKRMLKRLEAVTGANLTESKQQRRIATGL